MELTGKIGLVGLALGGSAKVALGGGQGTPRGKNRRFQALQLLNGSILNHDRESKMEILAYTPRGTAQRRNGESARS